MPSLSDSLWFNFSVSSGLVSFPDSFRCGKLVQSSPMATRRRPALLLDYGGVLTSPLLDSFASYCRSEDISIDDFLSEVLAALGTPGSVFAAAELGQIDRAGLENALARVLSDVSGRRIEPAGLKSRLFAEVRPDERMQSFVVAARAAGIRTAMVSNSWSLDDYPRDRFADLFDAVLISGEIGLRKPDAPIYLLAAQRLGREPRDCVFVDDLPLNVEGATAVGMTGVVHRSADESIPVLEDLLGCRLA